MTKWINLSPNVNYQIFMYSAKPRALLKITLENITQETMKLNYDALSNSQMLILQIFQPDDYEELKKERGLIYDKRAGYVVPGTI